MSPTTPSTELEISSPRDVFISPHSDDVCFSLACFAHRRQTGRLLNVFTISPYTTDRRHQHSDNLRVVTRQRCSEDALFAKACGLTLESLEFKDAMARSEHPFDASHSGDISRLIEEKVLASLVGPVLGMTTSRKPWLFVPMGIGGHVDHVAVLMVILRHRRLLAKNYQIDFVNRVARRVGMAIYSEGIGHSLGMPYSAFEDQRSGEIMGKLHVYAGPEHPHIAQMPTKYDTSAIRRG